MDFANQKARKVGVFTDQTVGKLLPMQMALESLDDNGITYEVFDRVRVEPNEQSYVLYRPCSAGSELRLVATPTSPSTRLRQLRTICPEHSAWVLKLLTAHETDSE